MPLMRGSTPACSVTQSTSALYCENPASHCTNTIFSIGGAIQVDDGILTINGCRICS